MNTKINKTMSNEAKKIREILKNDTYIIPRYQRNYAWGVSEISQLIKDIDEFFTDNKDIDEFFTDNKDIDEFFTDNKEVKSYYLGSLVCFKREDGRFELIDGQQRHTTLTLINLVLKNLEIKGVVSKSNLKFDSRKKIQNYLEKLYETEKTTFLEQVSKLNIPGTQSFKDAIEIIHEKLQSISKLENFANNFYENVYLFRIEVPEDTDLNHYFEIMNNRGEQLEKHEIVKAHLMGQINDKDQKEQAIFAIIWDACAEMNDYVYFNFDKGKRKKLFTEEGELNAKDFECICSILSIDGIDQNSSSLADIIENIKNDRNSPEKNDRNPPEEENYIKNKYKSVIDFPNFLLQVLKIKNDEVSLDDKKLLEQFMNNNSIDPKEFIYDLLKYRVLFDKFVIKQDLANADESQQNWGIRKLHKDFEKTDKTYKDDDEELDDEELVNLQVILYYSDPTNTYNDWLQALLKNIDSAADIYKYTKKVWDIAKGKFKKEELSYPEISIFNLYFIDFLLWKLYAENIKGKETCTYDNSDKLNNLKSKCEQMRKAFSSFKFRRLTSREHLLSQEHAKRDSIDEKVYNGIGNLCLISASQNSKGNKENPSDKKKMFLHDNSSLKRLIMFESFNNNKWGADEITAHEKEIKELISVYL